VQKLNQGSHPKKGCNFFRGSFFVTFLEKQKSKSKIIKEFQRNRVIYTLLNCKCVNSYCIASNVMFPGYFKFITYNKAWLSECKKIVIVLF
jgi:hypothetical protein